MKKENLERFIALKNQISSLTEQMEEIKEKIINEAKLTGKREYLINDNRILIIESDKYIIDPKKVYESLKKAELPIFFDNFCTVKSVNGKIPSGAGTIADKIKGLQELTGKAFSVRVY